MQSKLHPAHLANIQAKADSLIERFFIKVLRHEDTLDLTGSVVFLPRRTDDTAPGWGYTADVFEQTCTCAGFEKAGLCSHLIAAEDAVELERRVDMVAHLIGDEPVPLGSSAWRVANDAFFQSGRTV